MKNLHLYQILLTQEIEKFWRTLKIDEIFLLRGAFRNELYETLGKIFFQDENFIGFQIEKHSISFYKSFYKSIQNKITVTKQMNKWKNSNYPEKDFTICGWEKYFFRRISKSNKCQEKNLASNILFFLSLNISPFHV